jgi:hypothetical protein
VAAQVAGGEAMLRRVLLNLVINACEGDGERGAAHIDVEVRSDGARGRVTIDAIDDGPGFSADHLTAGPGQVRSTKVGGSGFGLGVALALAQASDGTLTRRDGSGGGAMVSRSPRASHDRGVIELPQMVHGDHEGPASARAVNGRVIDVPGELGIRWVATHTEVPVHESGLPQTCR